MSISTLQDLELTGRRVIVRVDFNVPMRDGEIVDDTRIRAALPTIAFVRESGAIPVLVSHFGRPKGQVVEELRLKPVAERLSELTGVDVAYVTTSTGEAALAAVESASSGDIVLLENIRFDPREEANDPALAEELARLGDLFVNDAFGAAHRAHASTSGVACLMPSAAGLLMERETVALQRLLDNPERPFVAILGGAKVSDKIGVIENLLDRVDALLLGGGMANTFLLASGVPIGNSLAEHDFSDHAAAILQAADERGIAILLPTDVVVAEDMDGVASTCAVERVGPDQSIFDIGTATVERFENEIDQAATVFWNGPMGVFERPEFAGGTLGVARAVAASEAFSVVGGGDSVAAIEQAGIATQISHLSTGGGASLEFVEGAELPGIVAMKKDDTLE